jgi:hypothetical protein
MIKHNGLVCYIQFSDCYSDIFRVFNGENIYITEKNSSYLFVSVHYFLQRTFNTVHQNIIKNVTKRIVDDDKFDTPFCDVEVVVTKDDFV